MTGRQLRTAIVGALLALFGWSSPGLAQVLDASPTPIRSTIDDNGVNLQTGKINMPKASVSVGTPENGLTYGVVIAEGRDYGTLNGKIATDAGGTAVTVGTSTDYFNNVNGVWVAAEANGSTLVVQGGTYVYTRSDGLKAEFLSTLWITRLIKPSGETLSYAYETVAIPYSSPHGGGANVYHRLSSINSNLGYQIKPVYELESAATTDVEANGPWQTLKTVRALNTTVEACPTQAPCTPTNSWPILQSVKSGSNWIYTDTAGRTSRFTYDASNRLTAVRYFGSSVDNITISYDTSGRISSVTKDGITTGYGYSDTTVNGDTIRTTTVTFPGGATRVLTFNLTKGLLKSDRNELNKTTTYEHYATNNRLWKVIAPEGNYTQLTYDSRGNVTETRLVSKTPGTPADVVTSAVFPSTCSNQLTCNKPSSTTDARGFTTTYSYDANHGGLLTVTAPAPTTGGVQPQTRYAYTAMQATYKDHTGATVTGGSVYQLTSVSACQTNANCIGTSDEARTTISRDTAKNLLPTSVTSGSGNGSVSATSSFTYDNIGNVLTVDGPLSGTADTVRTRYDSLRRVIGTVSSDPDGTGALKHRAVKNSYNVLGQLEKVETGTVNSQSDSDWNAISVIETADISYDANGRPTKQTLTIGGTLRAVVQQSYDSRGRVDCVVQRMNPATFASPPSSACTLATAGGDGPDRITKTIYNAASQVMQVQTAFGVAGQQRNEVTKSYTDNGQLQTVTDAENNLTTYEYDGHDRLVKTFFPSKTKGAGSHSTADYEQINYGSSGGTLGLVSSIRRRNNTTIAFTYDNLGRITLKNAPGTEPDVTFSYDNLHRLTGASQAGNNLTFTYDALGRNKTQGGPLGTVGFDYDDAGRRISMTYPGSGLTVHYSYLTTGELDRIRENNPTTGTVVADYDYDNQGRRQLLTRANGTTTDYEYDAMSRLQSLTENVGGTSHDNNVTFTYTPASEIKTAVRSNDVFAWPGAYNVNRSYTINGLNQVTQATTVGSPTPLTFGYDDNGNLTSSGSTSYTYDSENRLVSASGTSCPTCTGTASLTYDPAGRLYQITGGSTTTRFAYDGGNIIAEYNGSNTLLRRYVFGPGADEALVWYEGSGTTDRRFFHADERGSIVAVSNNSGTVTATQSYDEYGIPDSANSSRFQYTGQAWLPELGLYYYKARMYSPTLGRFLQTDPVGYSDGMNMYAYVRGNPVNGTDPSGRCTSLTTEWTRWTTYYKNTGEIVSQTDWLPTGSIWIGCAVFEPDIGQNSGTSTNGGGGGGGDAGSPERKDCKSNGLLSVLGKINALPNTLLGLVAAGVSYLAGKIMGTNPRFRIADNAIQLINSPLNINGRAYALGNVQVYPTGYGPDDYMTSYTGEFMRIGSHEKGHSLQAQLLGILFLPFEAIGSLFGNKNPIERGADKVGSGKSCSGF